MRHLAPVILGRYFGRHRVLLVSHANAYRSMIRPIDTRPRTNQSLQMSRKLAQRPLALDGEDRTLRFLPHANDIQI
jgi:hypothetical protein